MKYANSYCYFFPVGSVWVMVNLLYLCNVWNCQSYLNSNVFVSSIFSNDQFYLKCYFFHHRNPLLSSQLKKIQLSFNCDDFVLIFHKILKQLLIFIFIALGEMPRSLPKNVPYLRQQTEVIETSFLSIFLKMFYYIIVCFKIG